MDAKVDYLSFTVMEDFSSGAGRQPTAQEVMDAVYQVVPAFVEPFAYAHQWEIGGARGHYSTSLFSADTYSSVRWGGTANHILIEMPGTACQAARDEGSLSFIILAAAHRLTRLDIAVDVVNGCSPKDFVMAGYNERFKSYAEIVSESGVTEYVGSMKSERYARVYMYAPPHPRAGTLRIEHVLRSDYAKAAAEFIKSSGTQGLAEAVGRSFGWLSPTWQPEHLTDGKLRASRSDRHQPGRVRWLYQVVLPAIIKAHKEGLIDLDEFLRRLTNF